ncbi:hypothetical protein VTI28DRAFT_7396 [Corynascus sepedonium]
MPPPRPISAQPTGRSSTTTPSTNPIRRAATFSGSRPVFAVRRTTPPTATAPVDASTQLGTPQRQLDIHAAGPAGDH